MAKLGEIVLRKANRSDRAIAKSFVSLLIKDLQAKIEEYEKINDPQRAKQYFYNQIKPTLEKLYELSHPKRKEHLYWEVESRLREKFEMRLPKRKVFS